MLLVDRRKKEVRNDSVALGAVGTPRRLVPSPAEGSHRPRHLRRRLKVKRISARDEQALQGKSGLSF